MEAKKKTSVSQHKITDATKQNKVKVRRAFLRKKALLEKRPSAGLGTARTVATWRGGLHCTVQEGDWKQEVDMSPASGGEGRGPNPGMMGRSSLAACLSITIAYWAAYWDIELKELEVEVEADYDAITLYEPGPAYRGIRYRIRVASPATEEEITRLIDKAEEHTTYIRVFREANPLEREIEYQSTRPSTGA